MKLGNVDELMRMKITIRDAKEVRKHSEGVQYMCAGERRPLEENRVRIAEICFHTLRYFEGWCQ